MRNKARNLKIEERIGTNTVIEYFDGGSKDRVKVRCRCGNTTYKVYSQLMRNPNTRCHKCKNGIAINEHLPEKMRNRPTAKVQSWEKLQEYCRELNNFNI